MASINVNFKVHAEIIFQGFPGTPFIIKTSGNFSATSREHTRRQCKLYLGRIFPSNPSIWNCITWLISFSNKEESCSLAVRNVLKCDLARSLLCCLWNIVSNMLRFGQHFKVFCLRIYFFLNPLSVFWNIKYW